MNSGKTTALIQAAYNYEERDMAVLVVKPAVDSKGADMVVSRLGVQRAVDLLLPADVSAKEAIQEAIAARDNVRCILIDEAQFLEPKQVDDFFWFAIEQDIPVMAYGLRTDFKTCGFPGATRLLELAHELQELKTICRCGKKAMLNGRKRGGHFIFDGGQVAIEGEQEVSYESLCGACYAREQANWKTTERGSQQAKNTAAARA